MRNLGLALLQIAALSLAYVAFDRGARALGSPVPGSVIGAVTLAVLLLTDVVPLRFVQAGAELLLKYLALFFVPAAVVAVRAWPELRADIVAISVVSVVSTIVVLLLTGKLAARWERE